MVPASCLSPFQLNTLGFGVTHNSVVTLPRSPCYPVGRRVEYDECIRTVWFEVIANLIRTGLKIIIYGSRNWKVQRPCWLQVKLIGGSGCL